MERNKQPLQDNNSSLKLAVTIMIEKQDVLLILSRRNLFLC
jgi:hypothetical protein